MTRALSLILILGSCQSPSDDVDEYVDLTDLSSGLAMACDGATVCSGSPSGSNPIYSSTYRIGAAALSRGDLLQAFTTPVAGSATSVRLSVRSLRAFTVTPADPPVLHVDVYAISSGATPTFIGSPVAQGTLDLDPAPSGEVTVPLSGDPISTGTTYALHVYVDNGTAGAASTTLFGVGVLASTGYANGDAFRRSLRRTALANAWGDTRFRPAGSWDLAFALEVVSVPGAPSNVTATEDDASATVSWTAPASAGGSPVTSYRVTASPGGAQQSTADATPSLLFTGLSNGTAYTFTVAALNAFGTGADSPASDPVTPLTVPSAPQGLTPLASANTVDLSWSAPASNGGAPITEYVVYRAAQSGGPWLLVGSTSSPGFSDAGLASGTTFFYEVFAANAAGFGAGSGEVFALTAPAAPTGLVATGGVGQISLGWTAAAGATSYVVLRGNTPGGAYAPIASPTSNAYVHTSLGGATTHYYVVRAVNASGTSDDSTEASATTAPPAPTGLTATGGTLAVSLAWTAAPSAASYTVLRATSSGGSFSSVGTTSALGLTDSTAAAGTTYFYVVTATSPSGTGPASAEASAVTVPPTPVGLSAGGGSGSIALGWTATAGATSYSVRRSASSGSGYAQIATTTSPAYSDTGLADGATFYYVVAAVNGTGTSGNSAEASATTTVTARKSCLAWYNAGFHTSTTYLIDPDGIGVGNAPFTAYCDMDNDGGGWTLVVGITGSWNQSNASAVNPPNPTATGQAGKFSDAVINSIKDGSNPGFRLKCNAHTGFWMPSCNFSASSTASGDCVRMGTTWNGGYPGSGSEQGGHTGVANGNCCGDRLIYGRTDLTVCDNPSGWGSFSSGSLWVR